MLDVLFEWMRGRRRLVFIAGVVEQSGAQSHFSTTFLITVGLVEAFYFINIAFMAPFVFATPDK